jgi:hypothetical protein
MNAAYERVASVEQRVVFGEHPLVELPIDQLVRLPQVRSGLNPELPELKSSIQAHGLLNPIDVAQMDQAELETYIDFVNRTWRTNVSLEAYEGQRQADGSFYLVIAGHSRAEAIFQLQQDDEAGREYGLVAKVHAATTPEEIIELQLSENIHSKPPQERRAMAIVETYRYGLENGMWSNKAEFLRQSGGKFGRRVLDEAIGFSQLPPEARDFVFSGHLTYSAAVSLGTASDTLMEYVETRLGYDEAIPEGANEEFDRAYREEVALLIARIFNGGMSGSQAKKFIEGQVAHKKEIIGQLAGSAAQPELFLIPAEEQARAYRRQLDKELRQAIMEMERLSIDSVVAVTRLHARLVGEEPLADLEKEREERKRQFGRAATQEMIRLVG